MSPLTFLRRLIVSRSPEMREAVEMLARRDREIDDLRHGMLELKSDLEQAIREFEAESVAIGVALAVASDRNREAMARVVK